MSRDTIIILIIVGIALFIWVPAIVISTLRVLRKDKKKQKGQ